PTAFCRNHSAGLPRPVDIVDLDGQADRYVLTLQVTCEGYFRRGAEAMAEKRDACALLFLIGKLTVAVCVEPFTYCAHGFLPVARTAEDDFYANAIAVPCTKFVRGFLVMRDLMVKEPADEADDDSRGGLRLRGGRAKAKNRKQQ